MIFFPAVFVVFLFMRTYVLFVFVFISVPWYDYLCTLCFVVVLQFCGTGWAKERTLENWYLLQEMSRKYPAQPGCWKGRFVCKFIVCTQHNDVCVCVCVCVRAHAAADPFESPLPKKRLIYVVILSSHTLSIDVGWCVWSFNRRWRPSQHSFGVFGAQV